MKMKNVRTAAIVFLCGSFFAACAATGNTGYKTVQVSYDYSGQDRSAGAWRAFMNALDQCHISGYEDAQAAGAPVLQCRQGSAGTCSLMHATLQYDCFGLGYQTAS